MRLTDILRPDCLKVPLAATAKQQAIYELVDLLADNGVVADREDLRAMVWQRENTRTTGIGHGVAIPHGKSVGAKSLVLAIGKTATPIDFAAIDGKPVELIFLLVSPPDQTGPHIQALAGISRMLTDASFRASVRNAKSAEELYKLIVDHESKQVVAG
ncbi:MAG: PTS sugar transporter subunit IIA [Phycisphaerales bacterium]|nr:PTS sugar transporter subunit IIA [Phycisphaerales bacterium]